MGIAQRVYLPTAFDTTAYTSQKLAFPVSLRRSFLTSGQNMTLLCFKKKITRQDMAGLLLELCHKRAQQMTKELQHEFRETRFAVNGDKETITYLESFILNLWLTAKVLAAERELLDTVHDDFFRSLLQKGLSGSFVNEVQSKLRDRYARYYAAWDEKQKGSQFILGLEIYQCSVNDGRPDKEFLSHPIAELVISVLRFMSAVAELRSKFKVESA